MKRILMIVLSLALLISFAACAKEKDEPATTTAATTATTTVKASEKTTASTKKEQAGTTKKNKNDISFIYDGFWYQNEGNQVIALKFETSGSVTVNTYRRKNLSRGGNEPDSILFGSFKDVKNGTLRVCLDNESPEETILYTVNDDNTLSCVKDDPEGESTVVLQNFGTLSKDNAARMMLGDN